MCDGRMPNWRASIFMVVVERLDPARDLDAVLAIELASFTNPWTRESIIWELEHSDVARIWVLREDRAPPIAFCSCWLIFSELHIHTMAVHPEHRQRGFGRVLLEAVLGEAAREGARSATLEVRASNEPAIKLYERAGFVVRGRRTGYYERPVEDALIFWRDTLSSEGDPSA